MSKRRREENVGIPSSKRIKLDVQNDAAILCGIISIFQLYIPENGLSADQISHVYHLASLGGVFGCMTTTHINRILGTSGRFKEFTNRDNGKIYKLSRKGSSFRRIYLPEDLCEKLEDVKENILSDISVDSHPHPIYEWTEDDHNEVRRRNFSTPQVIILPPPEANEDLDDLETTQERQKVKVESKPRFITETKTSPNTEEISPRRRRHGVVKITPRRKEIGGKSSDLWCEGGGVDLGLVKVANPKWFSLTDNDENFDYVCMFLYVVAALIVFSMILSYILAPTTSHWMRGIHTYEELHPSSPVIQRDDSWVTELRNKRVMFNGENKFEYANYYEKFLSLSKPVQEQILVYYHKRDVKEVDPILRIMDEM